MIAVCDPYAELRDALRERRTRRGMTVAVLAEMLRVAGPTVTAWERGTRRPNVPEFIRWAAALGLRVRLAPDGMAESIDPLAALALCDDISRLFASSQAFARTVDRDGAPTAVERAA